MIEIYHKAGLYTQVETFLENNGIVDYDYSQVYRSFYINALDSTIIALLKIAFGSDIRVLAVTSHRALSRLSGITNLRP